MYKIEAPPPSVEESGGGPAGDGGVYFARRRSVMCRIVLFFEVVRGYNV
jgi:hypothetical protein